MSFWKNKHWEQKQTLVSTAKYFDLIITFCFSLYDSWMLSDKYTLKQVTFNLELQTFFSAEHDKISWLHGKFPFGLPFSFRQFSKMNKSRMISIQLFVKNFFPITSLKLKKIECILKKNFIWQLKLCSIYLSVCRF